MYSWVVQYSCAEATSLLNPMMNQYTDPLTVAFVSKVARQHVGHTQPEQVEHLIRCILASGFAHRVH